MHDNSARVSANNLLLPVEYLDRVLLCDRRRIIIKTYVCTYAVIFGIGMFVADSLYNYSFRTAAPSTIIGLIIKLTPILMRT